MSPTRVFKSLRRIVTEEARHRCGHCLSQVDVVGHPMEIDHIIPESKGGKTIQENLWLACRRCNEFKGARTHARNPETRRTVRLFNPRGQQWYDHFQWSDSGTEIIGLTPCGRATVEALRMNEPEVVAARRRWVSVDWHPPKD